jgi:glycosyltransferase involved in cell wall biosynthesis
MELYPHFVRWLRRSRGSFHIAVAPLVDNALNRSKSLLKYLEYTALGLPVVASNVGPYQSLQHGVNALLCDNTGDAWRDALRRLAEEPDLRSILHRNAMNDLTTRYLLKYHSRRLQAFLETMVQPGTLAQP